MLKKIAFWLIICIYPNIALSELPLTVENLISDKGKFRFDASVNYLNSERSGVATANPIIIQTGENSTVSIPTQVGQVVNNTDVWVTTGGFRYGVTHNLEIYGRASAISLDTRARDLQGNNHRETDSRFSDSWLGINYRFRNDIDSPAWIGFAEVQLGEKQTDNSIAYGKSFIAGFTTYQSYDPIVLSLTGSVQLNQERSTDFGSYKPGDSLTIRPSVGFAVNDKVTLTTGLNWNMQKESRVNDETSSLRKTRTSLDFGLGYALGKNDTLSINVRPSVSGENDVQIRGGWIHRF